MSSSARLGCAGKFSVPEVECFFDGSCQPVNPKGVACYGFVVYKNGKRLRAESGLACEPYTKDATNNYAEYTACLKLMQYLISNGLNKSPVVINGDSQLVIEQLKGKYKVKSKALAPLYAAIKVCAMQFSSLSFRWVERSKNSEADSLTNMAYRNFLNKKKAAGV